MKKVVKLTSSNKVKKLLPINKDTKNFVKNAVKTIQNIVLQKDKRKLLIIGPCSMDFESSVLEYAQILAKINDKIKDKIFIILRTYTSKPRTTLGWKGIIQSSEFGSGGNFNDGILKSRKIMIEILKMGLPIADELLYPQVYKYFDDLLCYGAIGARSVEDQMHRELASAADIPIGLKNPTSGDINVIVNGLIATKNPHNFILNGYEYKSSGNKIAHIILRGSNYSGISKSNIDDEYINKIMEKLNQNNIDTNFVIDLNHDNSAKNYTKQIENLDIAFNLKNKGKIIGFMVESYLFDGNQKADENNLNSIIRGKSITDSCIGIENTKILINKLYSYLT